MEEDIPLEDLSRLNMDSTNDQEQLQQETLQTSCFRGLFASLFGRSTAKHRQSDQQPLLPDAVTADSVIKRNKKEMKGAQKRKTVLLAEVNRHMEEASRVLADQQRRFEVEEEANRQNQALIVDGLAAALADGEDLDEFKPDIKLETTMTAYRGKEELLEMIRASCLATQERLNELGKLRERITGFAELNSSDLSELTRDMGGIITAAVKYRDKQGMYADHAKNLHTEVDDATQALTTATVPTSSILSSSTVDTIASVKDKLRSEAEAAVRQRMIGRLPNPPSSRSMPPQALSEDDSKQQPQQRQRRIDTPARHPQQQLLQATTTRESLLGF